MLVGISPVWGGNNLRYDTDALSYLNALASPPDATWAGVYNQIIRSFKGDNPYGVNVWNKIDHFLPLAAHTSQAGLVSIRNPSRVATLVNAPSFTAGRGFTTDGITNYIDSGFNPATMGVAYTLNSASMGIWRRSGTPAAPMCGWSSSNGTALGASTTDYVARMNNVLLPTISVVPTGNWFMAQRLDSAIISVSSNGVQRGTSAQTSSVILSGNIRIGSHAASFFSAGQYSAFLIGSAFTPTEELAIYGTVQAYLQAVGAD